MRAHNVDETSVTEAANARSLRRLLLVLCAALALVVAGNSALAIALPDIAADIAADQRDLTWIIDAYALTFAAFLLPAGIAADRVGRRTMLVTGLVIFGAAGIASAFSPDTTWLIGLRALAGVGAAAAVAIAAGLGPEGAALAEVARASFATGLSTAMWAGAGVLAVAAALCGVLAPGRSASDQSPTKEKDVASYPF